VADAIRDHYKPAGAEDETPKEPLGITVALADKFDSLVGLFAAGEKPTGSKDPYALRRMTLGIIRIILDNQLRLPLNMVLEKALDRFPHDLFDDQGNRKRADEKRAELQAELLNFFVDRLKVILKEYGMRHDLIDAVFAGKQEDDLLRGVSRVKALQEFLSSEDGDNLRIAYGRAANIVEKEEKKDDTSYDGSVDESLLEAEEEQVLASTLAKRQSLVHKALKAEDYTLAMQEVALLRGPVDAFFDNVIVNADNEELRKNRLHMLSSIRAMLDSVADFTRIEG
jgi:glycyl-tRNA synthetase beta chain